MIQALVLPEDFTHTISGRSKLPIVLCFDRGGQDFDMFDELAAAEC